MDGTEKAGWLADKICNGGDYAKEAAIVLVRQAEEIDRLRAGDTCGRQCEGTAYRIEARRLLARNEMLEQGAQRYEFVRTLAPFRFAELFQENLRGKLSFDQIIDRERHAAASLRASHKEMHNALAQGRGD